MVRKNRMSLIALALLFCMVLTVFAGCQKKQEDVVPETTEAVVTTEAATEPAIVGLTHEEPEGSMHSWELDASVWSSSNGATVTLRALPRAYDANQAVYFVVHLNGEKIEDIPCKWDGQYYTASADLEAADGYEYECVIFQGQGEGENLMLSDAYDSLVYLKTSLAAYCNLYISDFKVADEKFTVTAGFAHVQLPQLHVTGTTVALAKAELVFQLNGETIESQILDLPEGEGVGSHEASLSAISFNMPKMEDDYQLDLMLKVSLSNGEELTSNGGSWFYNNNELKMAAG